MPEVSVILAVYPLDIGNTFSLPLSAPLKHSSLLINVVLMLIIGFLNPILHFIPGIHLKFSFTTRMMALCFLSSVSFTRSWLQPQTLRPLAQTPVYSWATHQTTANWSETILSYWGLQGYHRGSLNTAYCIAMSFGRSHHNPFFLSRLLPALSGSSSSLTKFFLSDLWLGLFPMYQGPAPLTESTAFSWERLFANYVAHPQSCTLDEEWTKKTKQKLSRPCSFYG